MADLDETTQKVKEALSKWIRPLGLLWWQVTTRYYSDPGEVLSRFGSEGDEIVVARTYADWRYMEATIDINLLGIADKSQEDIERMVVHELIHILVNEMREDHISHEERVVTTLTKAVFWIAEQAE